MQYILARRGYPPGAIDAVFGPMTDTALRNFQRAYGLSVRRAGRTSDDLRASTRKSIEGDAGWHDAGQRPGSPAAARCPAGSATASARLARAAARTPGIDFPVPSGTRIGAAGVGVVEFAGWNSGGYGNLVVVRHRLGYTTWYAHMSRIAVSVGQSVTGGTTLGYVGSTGHATGPHLHFELRKNAVPIDPAPYLLAGRGDASELRLARGGALADGGVQSGRASEGHWRR